MHRKQKPRIRLRQTLKIVSYFFVLPAIVVFAFMFYFNAGTPVKAYAATENFTTGSYIINMGNTPATYSTGLKPYGMVYDLMVNYHVPIKWIIETTKIKDGTDFVHNGVTYKGAPFIIPKEYISTAVATRITYWNGRGVLGNYSVSSLSLPVYATLTVWPRLIIDDVSGNDNIITDYFDNAEIPSTAYEIGTPSGLTYCHDMWANPHGDPTWTTHGYLYNLATIAHSFIWMQCHAVSVTESVKHTTSPFEQLNFLTTNGLQCYSSNKCLPTVTETHGNALTPITHNYPTDPIMQFMGPMSAATNTGSEQWYVPMSTGGWRPTTKLLVVTADGTGTSSGIKMAYGPSFGDTINGYTMYEGGHNLDGAGSTAEKVAAQRAFFNFVLFAGIRKQISFTSQTTPTSLIGYDSSLCSVAVTGGSPGYTYSWTSTVGGTYRNANSASTYFKAPVVASNTTGNLICTVTDACGRQNFISAAFTANTGVLPIELKTFDAKFKDDQVKVTWVTASEINNSYFTIERSENGTDFYEVGRREGAGNSTIDISYEYPVNDPDFAAPYYRLRQTDFDGKTVTFEPVFVKFKKAAEGFAVKDFGPNPFSDRVKFNFATDIDVNYSLMSQSGSIIREGKLEKDSGSDEMTLEDLSELPAGIYYMVFVSGENKKLIKLLKS
jgi:hypothetical protein